MNEELQPKIVEVNIDPDALDTIRDSARESAYRVGDFSMRTAAVLAIGSVGVAAFNEFNQGNIYGGVMLSLGTAYAVNGAVAFFKAPKPLGSEVVNQDVTVTPSE